MAQTRGAYVAIDDNRVDAESPITESLMFDMRDQWFAALCTSPTAAPTSDRVRLPERVQTPNLTLNDVLSPDGLGGAVWKSVQAVLIQYAVGYKVNAPGLTPGVYSLSVQNDINGLDGGSNQAKVPVAAAAGNYFFIVDMSVTAPGGNASDVTLRVNAAQHAGYKVSIPAGTTKQVAFSGFIPNLVLNDTIDLYDSTAVGGAPSVSDGYFSIAQLK